MSKKMPGIYVFIIVVFLSSGHWGCESTPASPLELDNVITAKQKKDAEEAARLAKIQEAQKQQAQEGVQTAAEQAPAAAAEQASVQDAPAQSPAPAQV